MVNEDVYGLALGVYCGFGVRVAYLSAPPEGGAARRPILPIRQEALAGELPTKAEVIEGLTWGITEAVTRWGIHYGPKTKGDSACDAAWSTLAKQFKRASGRAVELKTVHYSVSIMPNRLVLMLGRRAAGGWIGSIIHKEFVDDSTQLSKTKIAQLAALFTEKIYPQIIKQMKALGKKR